MSSFHLALGENDAGVLLALKDELLQKLEPVQSIVETQKGKGHKDISNDAPDPNCSGNNVNQQCLQFSNGFQICLKMVNLRSKKGAGNVSVAHVTTMHRIESAVRRIPRPQQQVRRHQRILLKCQLWVLPVAMVQKDTFTVQ